MANAVPTFMIRPARLRDLSAMYRLAKTPELAAPNRRGAERWWIRDHITSKQLLFVAEVSGTVVGFIMGECATGRVAILHLALVQKPYRRHGLGASLTRVFEAEGRKRKMRCILAYANGARGWQRYLERIGYRRGVTVQEFQKSL